MSTSFIGISKILIVAGVGCGTVFYRNGRFSNLINRLQMLMKEVSPKYGDGAEVNVEDVDSTDVQFAVKGSTNSGDHVEGEDDADSADTQFPVKGFPNSEDQVEGEDANSTDYQMLADIQRDLQRIFDEFTGLKDLDEHFKLPPEDDDYQMFANLKRDLQQTFDEFTGLKDLDKSLDELFKSYDQPIFKRLEE
ncbi:hypothetical protein P8452_04950 [Trifolium repens]|nr:hypothetical protein QL285_005467 [Trifolium repens]WJX14732.1 hypothetical protein P8452_04950 [Trifolium repens]